MKNSESKPPKGLSKEAARWWQEIVEEYAVDDVGGRLILQTALESFDRMRRAQKLLKSDKEVILDRFGQKKAHPATIIERDAKSAMLNALRMLNLDLEPLRTGRPAPVER